MRVGARRFDRIEGRRGMNAGTNVAGWYVESSWMAYEDTNIWINYIDWRINNGTYLKAVVGRSLLAFFAQFAFDTTSKSVSDTILGKYQDFRRETLALDEPDRQRTRFTRIWSR